MTDQTPLAAVIALLRDRIDEDTRTLNALNALVHQSALGGRNIEGQRNPKGAVGDAAEAILRATGRPMNATGELVPRLREQGFIIKNPAGLAAMLLRSGKIVRTAPGMFAVTGGGGEV